DVLGALGRDRRALEAEPGLTDGSGRFVDDRIAGRAAGLERQVVARQLELEPDHVGREHAQRLLQQLLPCLVSFEDDDRRARHQPPWISTAAAWLHPRLYGPTRRMEAARHEAIPLR